MITERPQSQSAQQSRKAEEPRYCGPLEYANRKHSVYYLPFPPALPYITIT